MLMAALWIGKKLCEWALIAAFVLAYVDSGPGGDALNDLVMYLKDLILNIDWADLSKVVFESIGDILSGLWDYATDIKEQCDAAEKAGESCSAQGV